jgi:hypothetical protein
MSERQEYKFRIDALHPDSIPMARLAEYMTELARLYGEQGQVHFSRLEEGSAILVSSIEPPAALKIRDRMRQVREGRGPRDTLKAFKALDDLLAKDNAVGELIPPDGAEIVLFPGRTRPQPISYGPFNERGSLDGVVIRVGGRDDTVVSVLLKNGDAEYACRASVDLSKDLAKNYRGALVRVHGLGRWTREEDRTWTLTRFDIESFEVLDDASLGEMIKRLHAIEGGAWGNDASFTDILGLRRDPGDQH